jgi:hypothetical protein
MSLGEMPRGCLLLAMEETFASMEFGNVSLYMKREDQLPRAKVQ